MKIDKVSCWACYHAGCNCGQCEGCQDEEGNTMGGDPSCFREYSEEEYFEARKLRC